MKGTCNKCAKIGTDTGKGNSIQLDENRINCLPGMIYIVDVGNSTCPELTKYQGLDKVKRLNDQ